MAIWPWYGNGMLNGASYNDPRKFLQTHEYKNLTKSKLITARDCSVGAFAVKPRACGAPPCGFGA